MSYVFKDVIGDIYYLCWSCEDFMSEHDLNESDGFCPACSSELALSESPYNEDLAGFKEQQNDK